MFLGSQSRRNFVRLKAFGRQAEEKNRSSVNNPGKGQRPASTCKEFRQSRIVLERILYLQVTRPKLERYVKLQLKMVRGYCFVLNVIMDEFVWYVKLG